MFSAKFLKREQLEQDIDASEAIGVSIDGTGQVGTYFYTAPEIEQGWPKIDEKVIFLIVHITLYGCGCLYFSLTLHAFLVILAYRLICTA